MLHALVEHRDDVVKTRTQTINRLHVLLTQLLPAGSPRNLSADHAAQLLRGVRPRSTGPRTLRRLAVELIGEVRHLDRRIATTTTEISAAVTASASTLTELRGRDLTAGKILARVGDITRFRSLAAFASYTGTWHRPDRGVLRGCHTPPALPSRGPPAQLLPAHHGHHPNPTQHPWPGLLPAQTRRWEGPQGSDAMPQKEAIGPGLPPAHARHRQSGGGGPGRTHGGDSDIQRDRLNPYRRPFGEVTSRTRQHRPYNPRLKIYLTQRGAVNERKALSLATVNADVPIGAEVRVIWGEPEGGSRKPTVQPHKQLTVRAIVSPAPYSRAARDSYHSGWRTSNVSV